MHAHDVQHSQDVGFQVLDSDLSLTCLGWANQLFSPEAPEHAEPTSIMAAHTKPLLAAPN